jgi:hypothetical protein
MNQPNSPEAARISACTALLDRGWGKPTQPIAGDDEGDAIRTITKIELVGVRPADQDT